MGKTAVDAPRGTIFFVPPEELVLITDEKNPQYDPRVKLPINQGLVTSIAARGFKSIVQGYKDGDKIVVVAGRQRVRAAVEANKLRVSRGEEPVTVKVLIERPADEADRFGLSLMENANRQDESDLGTARKIARYMDLGRSEADVGAMLGLAAPAVHALLALLDLATPVQRAVEAGKLSTTAAGAFAKLTREEQGPALEAALAESGGKRVRVEAAKRSTKKARGRDAEAPPSKKQIARLVDHGGGLSPEAIHALIWVATGHAVGAVVAALASLAEAKPVPAKPRGRP